jgi:hypothetical protein
LVSGGEYDLDVARRFIENFQYGGKIVVNNAQHHGRCTADSRFPPLRWWNVTTIKPNISSKLIPLKV